MKTASISPPLSRNRGLRPAPMAFVLLVVSVLQASTEAPMFYWNNTITDPSTGLFSYLATIHGTEFQWISAQESDAGNGRILHSDYFSSSSSGGYLSIQGYTNNTSLATVSGSAAGESISGYVQSGSFTDSVIPHTLGSGLNVNNVAYNWTGGSTYSIADIENATVRVSFISDSYSGESGYLSVTTDADGNGSIGGSESGVVYNGTHYFNGAVNSALEGDYYLLGKSFVFSGGWRNWYLTSDGQSNRSLRMNLSESYASDQGGYLSFSYDGSSYPFTGSFWGYDPQVGSFSGKYTYWHNLTLDPRVSPSLVSGATTLWLEGVPFVFQSGSLTANGDIADVYVSTDDPNSSLTIQANIPSFRDGGSSAQAVVVVRNGSTLMTQGSYTADGTFALNEGGHIDAHGANRDTPFFIGGTSIWVGGSRLDFVSGVDLSSVGKVDTYSNTSVGRVTLRGTDANQASVTFIPYGEGSQPVSGSFAQGSFTMGDSSVSIRTQAPSNSPAFWLAGVVYVWNGDSSLSYAGPNGEQLSLSNSTGSAALSGSDGTSSFTGTYANNGKVFTVTFEGGTVCVAYPANADGSIWHSNSQLPAGLPPAIALPGSERIWQFLSTAPDETDPSQTSAYYGNAAARTPGGSLADHSCLLKIRADGVVTLSDYASWKDFTGTYNAQSHLFQSSRDHRLPMPLFCVNPAANNMSWGQSTPTAGLPFTVLVGGEVWHYTGKDSNGATVYQGYYSGQQMLLTPNVDGSYAVNLVDIYGGNASGIYRNGTFQVVGRKVVGSDGRGQLLSGFAGVTSISGDLDILGNVVTLGSLKGDVNATGVTFSFTDDGTSVSLVSGLNRPVADWLWNRSGGTSAAPAVPMMKLDAGHRLQLFSPAESATPAIVLNPDGGSRINGPLRVPESGDLSMGEFTHGPRPDGTAGN